MTAEETYTPEGVKGNTRVQDITDDPAWMAAARWEIAAGYSKLANPKHKLRIRDIYTSLCEDGYERDGRSRTFAALTAHPQSGTEEISALIRVVFGHRDGLDGMPAIDSMHYMRPLEDWPHRRQGESDAEIAELGRFTIVEKFRSTPLKDAMADIYVGSCVFGEAMRLARSRGVRMIYTIMPQHASELTLRAGYELIEIPAALNTEESATKVYEQFSIYWRRMTPRLYETREGNGHAIRASLAGDASASPRSDGDSQTGVADLTFELQQIVGHDNVLTNSQQLQVYERATFATTQRVPLVILPGSSDEIRQVVQFANEHKLKLYPVSRGRNWGLGSRVPVQSGCCVVDLQRMNRIVEYDECNAAITVEPGVTFQQVADYLVERKSELYLTAIGGPPDASVLANALERGDGAGPLGDRARYCTGLEIVLPSGEILHTGLGAYQNSLSAKLASCGLGPGLEGLFFQSNLGIVTRMTVFLARKPKRFQLVMFAAHSEAEVTAATDAVKRLQQEGVLTDTAYSLWNVYRFLTAQIRYPWHATGGVPAKPEDLLDHLPKAWKGVRWVGFIAVYSPSTLHAWASRRLLRRALKGRVKKLMFIGPTFARIGRLLHKPLTRLTGVNVKEMLERTYFRSVFAGHPTTLSTSSIYWRKRGDIPGSNDVDPDRDRSGLYWICVALPHDGKHVVTVTHTVEIIAIRYGLEPMCMFFNMNQWYLKSFIVLMWDRDVPEEEEAARQCHDELLTTLEEMGYSPVRLGIQSMQLTAPSNGVYIDVIKELKKLFDPNDILAPGRYDFRHRWSRP